MNLEKVTVLLVEDNPADVRMLQVALRNRRVSIELHLAEDGVEALEFLGREGNFSTAPRPDLILLDLNLPRLGGRELLRELKSSPDFRQIPIIVLSTSLADEDVAACYDLHANCYLSKPLGLDEFMTMMDTLESFWMMCVRLPPRDPGS